MVFQLELLEPRRLLSASALMDLQFTEGPLATQHEPPDLPNTLSLTTTATAGGYHYYTLERDQLNVELWRTDLTSTELVANLNASRTSNHLLRIANMVAAGDSVFFTVHRFNSLELWNSDGTLQGTRMLASFQPSALIQSAVQGDVLYFTLTSRPELGLWQSDGTADGTTNIYTGHASQPTVHGDAVYFAGNGYLHRVDNGTATQVSDLRFVSNLRSTSHGVFFTIGGGLYVTDGASAPQLIKDNIDTALPSLYATEELLYFRVSGNTGAQLWVTDGMSDGTIMVLNDPWPSMSISPIPLAHTDDLFYFVAGSPQHGRELWRSDGTAAGTYMVLDIAEGMESSSPASSFILDDILYFSAYTPETGRELWRSDGTAHGTYMVHDLYLAGSAWPRELAAVNGQLVLQATHGVTGYGLFTLTDGLLEPLHDFFPGVVNRPMSMTSHDGMLYFGAGDTGATGRELFRSDGTPGGTYLVKDIWPGTTGSAPLHLTVSGSHVFFSASSPSRGVELWKSDGTLEGTVLVKDIAPSSPSSSPQGLTDLDGILIFAATSGGGYHLWRSDGTPEGTVRLENNSGPFFGGNLHTRFGGAVYYTSNDLWRTNGTPSGTFALDLGNFNRPVRGSNPGNLTVVGDTIWFAARSVSGSTAYGNELWKSDGTAAGTVFVKNINTQPLSSSTDSSSDPWGFTGIGDVVFFHAEDDRGRELWKSDGTAAGTVLVKDIRPGSASSSPGYLTSYNGYVYFAADDGVHGAELWRSDGTAEGTVMVRDINPGPEGSRPSELIVHNGLLYFAADDGVHGRELWVSDGSTEGTYRVTDIHPGPGGSDPMNLAVIDNVLYFTANDGRTGPKLWRYTGDFSPPSVADAAYQFDAPVPAVTVSFSKYISLPHPEDVALSNLTTGTIVASSALAITYSLETHTMTLTFPGLPNGTLPDGVYRIELAAGSVQDAAGNPLAADFTSEFFVLAGDANRDGKVDIADLGILAANWQQSGMAFTQGDFNYDGSVTIADLGILAANWQKSLDLEPVITSDLAEAVAASEVTRGSGSKSVASNARSRHPSSPTLPFADRPLIAKSRSGIAAELLSSPQWEDFRQDWMICWTR